MIKEAIIRGYRLFSDFEFEPQTGTNMMLGNKGSVGALGYRPGHFRERPAHSKTIMSMSDDERSALRERWTAKSSNAESIRTVRAERMSRDAIDRHPSLQADRRSLPVYTTNVRSDSDVDMKGWSRQSLSQGEPLWAVRTRRWGLVRTSNLPESPDCNRRSAES